jgi:D-glycero-beta-D-manno-heptose 1-phosphate adenylyltransferase
MDKLKNWQEISEISMKLKESSRKIVFTNGCFDILHKGHITYLRKAHALGDVLIVGLNSDSSVKRLKGTERPINDELARVIVLSELISIDYIVIFNEDTPYNLIKCIKPDMLVKGGDWVVKDIVGSDIVFAYGGEVISLDFIEGYSSTELIERMKNGE